MKLNILKAKIKRNNLEEYAGSHFRDINSQIVASLNKKGKKALFGIEREDGLYTIIGEKVIYYSTDSGNYRELALDTFSEVLHVNAVNKGKEGEFEFLKLNDFEFVWLKNRSTMEGLWNIILWLEKLED